jgi:hypothetical protein
MAMHINGKFPAAALYIDDEIEMRQRDAIGD